MGFRGCGLRFRVDSFLGDPTSKEYSIFECISGSAYSGKLPIMREIKDHDIANSRSL